MKDKEEYKYKVSWVEAKEYNGSTLYKNFKTKSGAKKYFDELPVTKYSTKRLEKLED